MIVSVTITTKHIREGAPHSENCCAGANAIREALPGRQVELWSDAIIVDGYEIKPPDALVAWMDAYDDLKPVGSLTFEIDVPEAAA